MIAQPRTTPTVALAEQLAATASVVQAVTVQGRSLPDAMARVASSLRPGVQALAYHALRHWGAAMALSAVLVPKAPPPSVGVLLGVALTLLRAGRPAATLPDSGPAYPPHTVVDQAVAALRQQRAGAGVQGLLNACLRRYLREQEALESHVAGDAVARWNHPFWWVKQLRRDHPLQWQALLQANQCAAPMVLRVNRRHITRAAYLEHLAQQGQAAEPLGQDGVVLAQPCAVEHLPGWTQGWVSVQDGAAQWAAPLLLQGLNLTANSRVLDACAAPGGKTAHLLECSDAAVWALEIDAQRTQRMRDNLARLGLHAHVLQADAAHVAHWWDGQPFDAILLDAPCTASGIVRRHPDVRWLRRPEDLAQLVQQQHRLLEALWPVLRPGGHMLYATCSVFRAEGDAQMLAFGQRHPEAVRLPAPGHIYPGQPPAMCGAISDNVQRGFDGFYYALWRKAPA